MDERITVTDRGAAMLAADHLRGDRLQLVGLILHGILAGDRKLDNEDPSLTTLVSAAFLIADATLERLNKA